MVLRVSYSENWQYFYHLFLFFEKEIAELIQKALYFNHHLGHIKHKI